FQIVVRDISSHKQAESERTRLMKEIESERDRLTQILEEMPIGVVIAEAPSGRMIFHNHEAERLLRESLLPSETHNGYSKYGALHDDGSSYAAEDYPMARSLLSGSVISGEEMRYRRSDLSETFFSVNSAPIYDHEGRMGLIVGTFVDILESKRSVEAL